MANTTQNLMYQKRPRVDGRSGAFSMPDGVEFFLNGAVGQDGTTGLVKKWADAAADRWLGFSNQQKTGNTSLHKEKNKLNVDVSGHKLYVDVAGAADATAQGKAVYASDDQTFTLTAGNVAIGKVDEWVEGTKCWVQFNAASEK